MEGPHKKMNTPPGTRTPRKVTILKKKSLGLNDICLTLFVQESTGNGAV
jgi:hypothetical protein